MTDDKVVFLAFNNPHMALDDTKIFACADCRNKTFLFKPADDAAGRLECAACGVTLGKVGWIDD